MRTVLKSIADDRDTRRDQSCCLRFICTICRGALHCENTALLQTTHSCYYYFLDSRLAVASSQFRPPPPCKIVRPRLNLTTHYGCSIGGCCICTAAVAIRRDEQQVFDPSRSPQQLAGLTHASQSVKLLHILPCQQWHSELVFRRPQILIARRCKL